MYLFLFCLHFNIFFLLKVVDLNKYVQLSMKWEILLNFQNVKTSESLLNGQRVASMRYLLHVFKNGGLHT